MMQQSAILTILGMAIVFGFLAIMVFCINLFGKIINLARQEQPAEKEKTLPEIAAVISAAVNEYRKPKEYSQFDQLTVSDCNCPASNKLDSGLN